MMTLDTRRETVERLAQSLSIDFGGYVVPAICAETLRTLLERAEAAEARERCLKDSTEEARRLQRDLNSARSELDAAKSEAERLRDAIKQYACEQNWTEDYEWDGPGAPTFVARAALQENQDD